jgi:hypothetical protein
MRRKLILDPRIAQPDDQFHAELALPSQVVRPSRIVILSKRSLRGEGPGRAARSVPVFGMRKSRVWLASSLHRTRKEHPHP